MQCLAKEFIEAMETTIPFDLNRAIQAWRKGLAQSPAFHGENLDELESHLHDSLTSLQASGLSIEESFLIATRRIGESGSLSREFGKVNEGNVWSHRILWMLIGIQAWSLISTVAGSIALNSLFFGWRSAGYSGEDLGMVLPITLFSLIQMLALAAGVGIAWWLIIRKGQSLGGWFGPLLQRRSSFVACCIGLCVLSFLAYASSVGLQVLVFQSIGPSTAGKIAMYSNVSQKLIVWPVQVVAMAAVTLLLARRRLRIL